MSSPAARRRRLTPEHRRELILASALRVFAERGYHATAISEIARGAGTTKAVVDDHFPTKRALYDAVVAAERAELFTRVATLSDAGDFRDRVRAFAELFLAYVDERPHAQRIMLETVDAEPDVGRDLRANQRETTRMIAAELARRTDLLEGAPDRELGLEMVAQMMKSTVNGLADWWLDRPEVPRETAVEALTEFLVRGLAAFREDG